jgi:hypothetical protein
MLLLSLIPAAFGGLRRGSGYFDRRVDMAVND